MGDEPAAFDGEDKIGGDLLIPCVEGLGKGKAVEGYIQLDGPEYVAVVIEPLALGQVFRIEDAFPALITKAAASDPEFRHTIMPK